MSHPRVSAGPGHVLALWGFSFSFPGVEEETGGVWASEHQWALNKKVPELQCLSSPGPKARHPETTLSRSSLSQGQSDPLEETLSWTENPKPWGWGFFRGGQRGREGSINWAAS